jgi:hypothetical protein
MLQANRRRWLYWDKSPGTLGQSRFQMISHIAAKPGELVSERAAISFFAIVDRGASIRR